MKILTKLTPLLILILSIILVTLSLFTITRISDNNTKITILLEQAYFDGQLDAINNDIRIKFNPKINSYQWIKSPWDNNRKPLFIPDSTDNKGR